MKTLLCSLLAWAALLACASATLTAQQTQQAAAQIDTLLAAHWKSAGVKGQDPVSEEVFVRRIYLDLAGRIPTAAESLAYLGSKQPDKRAALIDDLLSRESYVSHFYNIWADILRFRSRAVNRANIVEPAYERFIKASLRTNKPYDQFVRELLSARGYAWENGAIGYYQRDPDMPLDNLALTARVFLGTRIECAQCHNHPFDKWKQTDFYHLAAFTYPNDFSMNASLDGQRDAMRRKEKAILDDYHQERAAATDGGQAAEARKKERFAALDNRSIAGIVKRPLGQLLAQIGLDRKPTAVLKLPFDFSQADGQPGDIMKPQPLFGALAELSPASDAAAVFARWVASPENPRFTKIIVNRLWKTMFGVALTEPLDELRDDTKAMAPEVEAYLEKLMVAVHYDMRAFLAVIANTRAYQSAVLRDEYARGDAWHFQAPLLQRMTAEQIWDSLVALASYEPDARDLGKETREARRIAVSQMAHDAYVNFGGEELLQLALARLETEHEDVRRNTALAEAEVVAKRSGDAAQQKSLSEQSGRLVAERAQEFVQAFIMPMLTKLAQKSAGKDAVPVLDATYKMNTNPRALLSETWRRMYVPGYGPAPRTPEQVAAEAQAERERLVGLATKLGYTGNDGAGFIAYYDKGRAEWRRASELESPAPRGHFLRTMGQSDRDFVENANPNASIPQALALMNSDLASPRGLLSPFSPLMHFINQAKSPEARLEAAFIAVLSRKPTAAEKAALPKDQTPEGLVYALLNTKQFIFIQ